MNKLCRKLLLPILLLLSGMLWSQVVVHSHNDYLQSKPLLTALEARAQSIEVDVFLVKGNLLVAHSLKETSRKKNLVSLYINPIINLFKKNNGRIGPDSGYVIQLMIDIKQNGREVLDSLVSLLEPYRNVFDRSVNPRAVRIVISGDRGEPSTWKNYPAFIWFDGRPYEQYDEAALAKIAFVSDNYFNYIETRTNRADSVKIKAVVEKANAYGKPMRFWAAPDNPATWKSLVQYGAGIINTDKPEACRFFLTNELK